MKALRTLPLALWLPALAAGVALFLVFVWPTPYRYPYSPYVRVNRFTGQVTYQTGPGQPWQELQSDDVLFRAKDLRP